eukprot:SAG31_NODE_4286_length_3378_cov_6.692894_1_plen_513_part_00
MGGWGGWGAGLRCALCVTRSFSPFFFSVGFGLVSVGFGWFRLTYDLAVGAGDHVRDGILEGAVDGAEVDRLAAERLGLSEALRDHVADDDARRAEQVARCGRGEADGASARDVHDRAGLHARLDGAVEAGGEDVRQQRQVLDLLDGLVLVGELQQVEVRVRDHDVLGLPTDPAAHVHVAVGGAGARRVHVEADAGVAALAGGAAAARDVERDGADVADVEELAVVAELHDLAGDLVPEDHVATRERGATADHVLVGAADVGRDDLEDRAVVAFALKKKKRKKNRIRRNKYRRNKYRRNKYRRNKYRRNKYLLALALDRGAHRVQLELRVRDALDLDVVRAHEDHAAVGCSRSGGGEVPLGNGLAAAATAAAAISVGLPELLCRASNSLVPASGACAISAGVGRPRGNQRAPGFHQSAIGGASGTFFRAAKPHRLIERRGSEPTAAAQEARVGLRCLWPSYVRGLRCLLGDAHGHLEGGGGGGGGAGGGGGGGAVAWHCARVFRRTTYVQFTA